MMIHIRSIALKSGEFDTQTSLGMPVLLSTGMAVRRWGVTSSPSIGKKDRRARLAQRTQRAQRAIDELGSHCTSGDPSFSGEILVFCGDSSFLRNVYF